MVRRAAALAQRAAACRSDAHVCRAEHAPRRKEAGLLCVREGPCLGSHRTLAALHPVRYIPYTLRLGAAQAVQLALGCLSFDFVGTCLDESAEDLGTIQARQGRGQGRGGCGRPPAGSTRGLAGVSRAPSFQPRCRA